MEKEINTTERNVIRELQDIELFPAEITLSWNIAEPDWQTALELLMSRLRLLGRGEEIKIRNFKLNSKVATEKNLRRLRWIAEIDNRDFKLSGTFIFVRLGSLWKARIC